MATVGTAFNEHCTAKLPTFQKAEDGKSMLSSRTENNKPSLRLLSNSNFRSYLISLSQVSDKSWAP